MLRWLQRASSKALVELTLSIPFTVYSVRTDRDLPPTTSSEATTAIGAATCTAVLARIMIATSELPDEPQRACELWLKDICRDEQDDYERVGGELHSKPTVSYASYGCVRCYSGYRRLP